MELYCGPTVIVLFVSTEWVTHSENIDNNNNNNNITTINNYIV